MKKSKNIRMDEWMFDFIEELALTEGVDSSVWIRQTLADRLEKQGLTRAVYYNRRTVRAREAAQDNFNRRGG